MPWILNRYSPDIKKDPIFHNMKLPSRLESAHQKRTQPMREELEMTRASIRDKEAELWRIEHGSLAASNATLVEFSLWNCVETLYHSQPFVFEGSVWNEWRSVISGEEVKVRNPKFAFVQSHPARNFMVEKGWGRDTMQQLTGLSEAIGLVPFARWPLGWHFGKWVDVWCVPEVPKMREGQLQLKQLHDFARIFAEVKTWFQGFISTSCCKNQQRTTVFSKQRRLSESSWDFPSWRWKHVGNVWPLPPWKTVWQPELTCN